MHCTGIICEPMMAIEFWYNYLIGYVFTPAYILYVDRSSNESFFRLRNFVFTWVAVKLLLLLKQSNKYPIRGIMKIFTKLGIAAKAPILSILFPVRSKKCSLICRFDHTNNWIPAWVLPYLGYTSVNRPQLLLLRRYRLLLIYPMRTRAYWGRYSSTVISSVP